MSDWVEYCNLPDQGYWAKQRRVNGCLAPHQVHYWSIGNENYGAWEMGAKTSAEWGRFVLESARVKPEHLSLEFFSGAASLPPHSITIVEIE
jgi:alpha-N-arabinofuranosidase